MERRAYQDFSNAVQDLLSGTASGKGYNRTGMDGQNDLYEFVQATAGGHGHAAGEIIYKIRRYMAKGNPEDLLKVAAWSFLIWRHHGTKDS